MVKLVNRDCPYCEKTFLPERRLQLVCNLCMTELAEKEAYDKSLMDDEDIFNDMKGGTK